MNVRSREAIANICSILTLLTHTHTLYSPYFFQKSLTTNYSLNTPDSLPNSHYSRLTTPLLTNHYLLITHYSFVTAHYTILFTQYTIRITNYSRLTTQYLLITNLYSPLA